MVFGLGHDVVDVAAFAQQLAEPGSHMRGLFSTRELRQADTRAQAKHDGKAVHLASKWAGKEAVLKAWCEALTLCGETSRSTNARSAVQGELRDSTIRPVQFPYTLDNFPWSQIEILDDVRGIPHVILGDDPFARLSAAFPDAQWHISLSHDGPIASAVAILELC
ncbi:4'-phosphopantetheinyl transferase [Bifidobacterium hapali]|uniref:4'-phosphopantetheinyl transferase n=1 Tax=Bifidobacterium hapali TaxID=1630172 RepID=A0A261FXD1_9BIFI|nr:holo-ACP synthase [Bifidobacterium hapali]OZG63768.1 4'-phosphopantetheinyl transferase [Bifidobacterium hapali]